MKLIPTILCGAAGSRLWPVSRELHPEPFIRLADAAERLTVANREVFFKTADEYREVAGICLEDLSNSFILEPFGRNTAPAIGLAAIHVVATHGEDALFLGTHGALPVADRKQVQGVKHLYASLYAQVHNTHKLCRRMHRPWRTDAVREEGQRFKIKCMEVKPGASLCLRLRKHCSKRWIAVGGVAKVVNAHKEFLPPSNQSTFIPATHPHRLSNPDTTALVMTEVQSGDYLGEDDTVRLENH